MSYLDLLLLSGGTAFLSLFLTNRNIFIKNKKIFLKTVIGSLIFAIPWFSIAIINGVWFYKKSLLGFNIFFVPFEELIFISFITLIYTYVTLIAIKNVK